MTRRTALSTLIALFVMTLATLIGSTDTARAQQNPNCCKYTVNIQGIPDFCLPFRIYYRWDCISTPVIASYAANGISSSPIPTPPPCPPACILRGISLDGINYIGPNETRRYVIGNCCSILSFGFDAAGCIAIKVSPC